MKNVIKPNNKRLVYDWLFLVYSRVFGKIGFHISHMKELCDWFTTIIIFNLWLLIGSPTLLNVFFFFCDHGNKQTKKWTNWLLTHDPEDPNIYIYNILCWGVVFNYLAGSCRKFQSCPVLCLKRGHASIPFSLSPHMFPYLAPDISWFSSIIKTIIKHMIIWSQNSRLWWWFLMCPAIVSHLFPCVAIPSGQWDTEP